MMDFDALMREFAQEIGIDGIEPDEDGCYRLSADDVPISVGTLPESGALAIWAEAGQTPPEGREAFYRMLLEAAYAGGGTSGAQFSLDRRTGMVILRAEDPSVPDTLAGLQDRLDAFADTLGDWRRRIADFRTTDTVRGAAAAEAEPGFGQEGFIRI